MEKTHLESINWYVSQIKGSTSDDIVDGGNFTCVEFNQSGELLAAGDKGGQITVYRSNSDTGLYDVYCAFTSHEPEFDYLKSLEIEEKINSITWLPNITSSHNLLSANDKTIKLWRLSERQSEAYNFNTRSDDSNGLWADNSLSTDFVGPSIPNLTSTAKLRIPKFRKAPHLVVEARPKRIFANAHNYHINAVSLNSDQETFLSADDLRINLWHLDVSSQSFTIVDLKPSNMEDLNEVITCARFHPVQCHLLAYSTSRGVIRLCDMRHRALCDNHVMVFEDPNLSQNLGFFADIIASLSDFRFGYSGNYILARDYLTLKVWDIRMGDRPCELYPVHEPFRSQLCVHYENDSIFDKFLCVWSNDDRYALTGSYGNLLHLFDRHTGSDWLYDLNDPTVLGMDPPFAGESFNIPLPPKRFLSPDDPLGLQFGLSSIYVASLDGLESVLVDPISQASSQTSCSDTTNDYEKSDNSPEMLTSELGKPSTAIGDSPGPDNSTDALTPPIGSKRRKQILPSRTNDSDSSHSPLSSSLDTNHGHRHKHRNRTRLKSSHHKSKDTSLNGTDQMYLAIPGIGDSPKDPSSNSNWLKNKFTIADIVSGRVTLPGMHQLDCQRKFLHLAWHPKKPITVAASANQLYIITGHPPSDNSAQTNPAQYLVRTANDDCAVFNDDDDDNIDEHIQLNQAPSSDDPDHPTETSIRSPEVKAPKRRRRRHYPSDGSELGLKIPAPVCPPDPTLITAPANSPHSNGTLNPLTVQTDLALLDKMDFATSYEADREDNVDEETVQTQPQPVIPSSDSDNTIIPCINPILTLNSDSLLAPLDNGGLP